MNSSEIQAIAAEAIQLLEHILPNILPGGRLTGREYSCANLSGGAGESTKVNIATGKWSDFATGEAGGDPVSLLAAIRKCSQSDAAAELASIIGHTTTSTEQRKAARKEIWTPIFPVPSDAPPPPLKHYQHGEPVKIHEYRNRDGLLLQLVHRYELPPEIPGEKNKKQFAPVTFCRNESGRTEWRFQAFPDKRPLYGLEFLADTVKFILIVEGEKACDAARRLLGDSIPVITWSGGSNAVHKTDWAPVKGLRLCMWPDADTPGGKAGLSVVEDAMEAGAESVKIVVPPSDVFEGFDLADAEDQKWSQEKIMQLLKVSVSPEEFKRLKADVAAPVPEPTPEPTSEGEENNEPLPIEQRRFAPRLFPFEIFTEPFYSLVKEYATALQVPPEIIMMYMMTVASATIGNSIVLRLKRGWDTPPFLWTAIIGDTGSGKSHSGEAIMQPVKEQQGREATRYKNLMDEYNNALAVYKSDKKNNTMPKEPEPMRHFYTTNFTIESLIPMYQANARGLVIHVDELAGLFRGLNQYKSSGNDQEQLLSLFNAGDIKADRKSGGGYVRNSGAAAVGGIQYGIMSQVFGESDYVNGMVYRILPVMMDSTPPRFTMDSISKQATETWRSFVDWTFQIPLDTDPESGRIKPLKLTLEPDALEAWAVFHDRYAESEPFVSLKFKGYLPKLRTYCLKFMTILHVMECYRHDTLATVVSLGTVNNSILLTEYFAGQALQLIRGAAEERNPYHATLHKALESLQGEVTGGRLLLSRIRERMNELLPVDMQVQEPGGNKQVAAWLRGMKLTVTPGAGNKSFLVWESEKIFS